MAAIEVRRINYYITYSNRAELQSYDYPIKSKTLFPLNQKQGRIRVFSYKEYILYRIVYIPYHMDTPIEPFSQISTNCLRNRTARLPGATSAIFSGNFSKYIAYFVMANISTPRIYFRGLFLVCQGQFYAHFAIK